MYINSWDDDPASFSVKIKQTWLFILTLIIVGEFYWRLRHLNLLFLDHLFDEIGCQRWFLVLKSEMLFWKWSFRTTTSLNPVNPDNLRFGRILSC